MRKAGARSRVPLRHGSAVPKWGKADLATGTAAGLPKCAARLPAIGRMRRAVLPDSARRLRARGAGQTHCMNCGSKSSGSPVRCMNCAPCWSRSGITWSNSQSAAGPVFSLRCFAARPVPDHAIRTRRCLRSGTFTVAINARMAMVARRKMRNRILPGIARRRTATGRNHRAIAIRAEILRRRDSSGDGHPSEVFRKSD